MSDLIVPDDQGSDPIKSKKVRRRRRRRSEGENHGHRSKGSEIPSIDNCLRALSQLPGLIAMKVITTPQANSIRGVYTAILQQHQKSEAGGVQQKLPDDNVMEILRKNPDVLSMIEPLLTDEQIDKVMKKARDGGDEPA